MDPRNIAFIEPHLRRYGGIRRVVELSNALVDLGHRVTVFVPPWEPAECTWMPCRARVERLRERHDEPYDLVVFNHEPQWYLLDRFVGARAFGVYALHYSKLYGKEGSWEALRVPVDLRLANSTWTADQVEREIGHRPVVLLGGINADHFRPVQVPKRYPILCMGGDREWKGTDDILAAARLLDLPVETYDGKDLPQEAMAAEYAAAEVFVVGSHFEGFGQPGLEALACGTPLVTTDNGGCRDYAFDGETALVVPPRDPVAMANAIARLRADPALARRLSQRGLELVRDRFSWPLAARRFIEVVDDLLTELSAGPATGRHPSPRDAGWTALRPYEPSPELTVVVLTWDNLALTQRCVESLRQHTDVPYELVVVDNGSAHDAAEYVRQAADVAVMHDHNTGFAAGMNDGLAQARGRAVAFLNNDIEVPARWASRLLETLSANDRTGVVVPALTEAGNVRTVRTEPGNRVEALAPFEAPPSAVCYVMPTQLARDLGGWDTSYQVASGEDLELAFSVWVNDRDIVFDTRVLVEHVGHATSDIKLPDRRQLWAANRRLFLDRWSDPDVDVVRLHDVDAEVHARHRRQAAVVATWMDRYFRARDRAEAAELASRGWHPSRSPVVRRLVRGAWPRLRAIVPRDLRDRVWPHVRGTYYRFFPDRHPAALRGQARPEEPR